MKLEFHPQAELELLEAALRYDLEVPGLGERFGTSREGRLLVVNHTDRRERRSESLVLDAPCAVSA